MSNDSSMRLRCISPIDGLPFVERRLHDAADVARALERARIAQRSWRATALAERQSIVEGAVAAMNRHKQDVAVEITRQMGRPIAQSPGEVGGFSERARHMVAIAADGLADVVPEPKPGFRRFIRREPLGVVFVVAPWNYPYLTAVNAVVPALLARWPQAARTAQRLARAARDAEQIQEAMARQDLAASGTPERLALAALRALPLARQRNVLRYATRALALGVPDARHLARLLALLGGAARSACVQWPGGEARTFRDHFFLMPPLASPASDQREETRSSDPQD